MTKEKGQTVPEASSPSSGALGPRARSKEASKRSPRDTAKSVREKPSALTESKGEELAHGRGGSIVTILVIVLVILGAYYLLTGVDPLGLFTEVQETPTATLLTGDWWRVYFTDPQNINDPNKLEGSVASVLISYINNARRSIHIAAFEFDFTPIAQALVAAHKRGVEVQWITDDENGLGADEDPGHGQFAQLQKAGIEVRHDGRSGLMHNKFWIFDSQIVWTGSTNATVNDNFRNNNNVLVIDSPEVAAIYEWEFAEMWEGKFGPTSPSTANQQSVTIGGTPIQVLFAPEDKVINRLIHLINGAQKSVRFMAFSFTHDGMAAALLKRAQAGVDVRGIIERRSSQTEYSVLATLYCARVPVRQDGNPATFHHKVLIIDDELLVTGSLNFSGNADTSNDENVIILTSRDIVAQYLQEFERRWAEAVEPDASIMQCR